MLHLHRVSLEEVLSNVFLSVVFARMEVKENRHPGCSRSCNTVFCVGVSTGFGVPQHEGKVPPDGLPPAWPAHFRKFRWLPGHVGNPELVACLQLTAAANGLDITRCKPVASICCVTFREITSAGLLCRHKPGRGSGSDGALK